MRINPYWKAGNFTEEELKHQRELLKRLGQVVARHQKNLPRPSKDDTNYHAVLDHTLGYNNAVQDIIKLLTLETNN